MTEKEEKIKHLENLKAKVDRMKFHASCISEITELINGELTKDDNNNTYNLHLNNTISKQLNSLLTSKKKPENRSNEFYTCRNEFVKDINRFLMDLRSD